MTNQPERDDSLETYLVGGAVRDRLLDLVVVERDWVVVGATAEQLTQLGYRSVGKDFPVFLHPRTQEEYALARTERKSGQGHRGFICDANEAVTLEQDLARRDLTINAIAEDSDGNLIDHYGGLDDLQARLLRHVSAAFAEDPLRILRVARFMARFAHLGFQVATETMALMQDMVDHGDLRELTPERVFMECEKALKAPTPGAFFELLQTLGAHRDLWPELSDFSHLARLSEITDRPEYRYAALFLNIPADVTKARSKALKAPNRYTELAVQVSQGYATWLTLANLNAEDILGFFTQLDAFRRHERFNQFMAVSALLATSGEAQPLTSKTLLARWQQLHQACTSVSASELPDGLQGPAISQAMRALQLTRIKTVLAELINH